MNQTRPLFVALSIHFAGIGFTSAAVALARHMPLPFRPVLFIPQVYGGLPAGMNFVRPFPPIFPASIAFQPPVVAWARRRNELNLLNAVERGGPGSVVWLWPGASVELQRQLKKVGAIVIREMINTHDGTGRRILDAEYSRVGLPPTHGVTEEKQLTEIEQLALNDFIVSPSECVDDSLLEWGVRDEQIIRSTFGWSPEDFNSVQKPVKSDEGVIALFVGQVGIRKGIHLALAAWDLAGISGKFVIVGREDAEVAPLLAKYRSRPDVRFVPFTRDLGRLYLAADFLFFPTLEEGAPLVCYQAAGCGLPILTGPMGRGRLVEHGTTGFVADPHDIEALAGYLRRLSVDNTLRASMSERIRRRASNFTWDAVAAQRAEAFSGQIG